MVFGSWVNGPLMSFISLKTRILYCSACLVDYFVENSQSFGQVWLERLYCRKAENRDFSFPMGTPFYIILQGSEFNLT